MMVEVVEDLLQAINTNESLKPYLKKYPFPVSDLKIHLKYKDARLFSEGTLLDVVLQGNEITYSIYDSVLGKESYSEAQNILENLPMPDTFLTRLFELGYSFYALFIIIFYFIVFVFFGLIYSIIGL